MKNLIILICSVTLLSFKGYSQIFSVTDFGAKPGFESDNTREIQKAIDICSQNGGGTVLFPAGIWKSGTIFLKSNVAIHLSFGSIWQGVNDITAYPFINSPVPSREDTRPRRAMIYAHNIQNVKIYGEGKLYPGGDYSIFESSGPDQYYSRPFGIHLVECTYITIDGIRMENSAFWMQRYFHCDNLKLTNLTIYNHVNENNDGIDIDGCSNVLVNNCIIDSSDDALVLKSEGIRPCEDVVINNCILSSHATPLKLGTGSVGGFKRITISNIIIRPSLSKEMLHPANAWGGLSGIDLLCVDGGIMEDIVISNVVMNGVETPLFIKLGNRNSSWPDNRNEHGSLLRNIRIDNLIARECGPISSAITGYPGNKINNVELSNFFISLKGKEDADTRTNIPENSGSYPFNRMFGGDLPSYGFFLRHLDGLTLNNIHIKLENSDPRPAIILEDAENVVFNMIRFDDKNYTTQNIIELNNVQLKIVNDLN